MGDFGKGLKSFKKGMKEDDAVEQGQDEQKVLDAETVDMENSEPTKNKATNT